MNVCTPCLFATLIGTLPLLLAACGGAATTTTSAAPVAAMPATVALAATRAVPDTASLELFDAQGRALPTPATRVPAHTAARTRPGLYATTEQLEWQELIAGPSTVVLDIDQMGPTGAALLAQHVRHWRSADERGLAWYVRGGNEEDAAQLVNRLSDEGVAPVFLVR